MGQTSMNRSRILEVLIVTFTIIGGILLLNLLIALMASTYERVRELGTKKVSFNRISHTHSVIHQNALLPPPLNIVVVICAAFWVITDSVIRCCTGGHYVMNIEKISRIKYSLKKKCIDLESKQEHKHSYSKSHKLLDINYGDLKRVQRVESITPIGPSQLEPTFSSSRSSSSYLSLPLSDHTLNDPKSISNDSGHSTKSTTNLVIDDDNYCFQKSPRSFSKRTFCKYCRHDMRDEIGSIQSYFDLFRHFRILDDDDKRMMRHLLKHRMLCPICFRPFSGNNDRYYHWQVMLEVISHYIFIVLIWFPLLLILCIPCFVSWIVWKFNQRHYENGHSECSLRSQWGDHRLDSLLSRPQQESQRNTRNVIGELDDDPDSKEDHQYSHHHRHGASLLINRNQIDDTISVPNAV